MTALGKDDVIRFHEQGFVAARGAISADALAALKDQLVDWVAESRGQTANYGTTIDGRARFDLEAGHSPDQPRLRRVNNPAEISDAYAAVLRDGPIPAMVAALIGPDVKIHHGKINLKRPGTDTRVGYHQDFPYTPHTNDDLVTVLVMLDDMTRDNGCLMVVPGSHREGLKSLWRDGRFTGETAPEVTADSETRAVAVTGRAGDACLMHTSTLHGSAANRSAAPRGLYIMVYAAADAFPLCPSPLPNRFEGDIVRGAASRVARLSGGAVELPPAYGNASFFEVQGQISARGY